MNRVVMYEVRDEQGRVRSLHLASADAVFKAHQMHHANKVPFSVWKLSGFGPCSKLTPDDTAYVKVGV